MGTRSCIATRTEAGTWKGRYVHWDGYLEGVGQAVKEIVARDGRDKAVQTLILDNYGWSTVDAQDEQELSAGYDDGRFVAVPGYGVAYTTHKNQSSPDDWVVEEEPESYSWLEYVHVIEADGSVTSSPL